MVSHGHEAPPAARSPGRPELPAPRARAAVASLDPGRSEPWIAAGRPATARRIFADVGWDETGRWDLAGLADLAHCEAFLPNAEEAMRYTRTDCPRAAAHALAERVPLAVVTLGAEGAYAVDGRTGETAEVPGDRGGGAGPDRRRGRLRRRLRHRHPRRLAARRPAGLRRADRRPVGPGVRRLAVRARLGRDRRLVAAGRSLDDQDPARAATGTPSWRGCSRPTARPWPLRRAVPTIGFRQSERRQRTARTRGSYTRPVKALWRCQLPSRTLGDPEVVEQRQPCNGRYAQATEPAHDSDTHSSAQARAQFTVPATHPMVTRPRIG